MDLGADQRNKEKVHLLEVQAVSEKPHKQHAVNFPEIGGLEPGGLVVEEGFPIRPLQPGPPKRIVA